MTVLFAYKTGDTSRVSTTVLANDPDLAITLEANTSYLLTFGLLPHSLSGVGIKVNMLTAATLDRASCIFSGDNNQSTWLIEQQGSGEMRVQDGTAWITNGTTVFSFGGTGDVTAVAPCYIKCAIKVGGTGGVLNVRWAQTNSDPSNTTMKAGSFIHAESMTGNLLGVIKAADQAVTSSSTLITDAELVLPSLVSGATYIVDCGIISQTEGGGMQGIVNFSGSTTDWSGHCIAIPVSAVNTFVNAPTARGFTGTAFNTTGNAVLVSGASVANRGGFLSRGFLRPNAAGDLRWRWAQFSGNASPARVLAGSWLTAKRIA